MQMTLILAILVMSLCVLIYIHFWTSTSSHNCSSSTSNLIIFSCILHWAICLMCPDVSSYVSKEATSSSTTRAQDTTNSVRSSRVWASESCFFPDQEPVLLPILFLWIFMDFSHFFIVLLENSGELSSCFLTRIAPTGAAQPESEGSGPCQPHTCTAQNTPLGSVVLNSNLWTMKSTQQIHFADSGSVQKFWYFALSVTLGNPSTLPCSLTGTSAEASVPFTKYMYVLRAARASVWSV